MIEVWHLKDEVVTREQRFELTWIANEQDLVLVANAWKGHLYEKVAEVATDDLELAYRLTNNIESSWSMEPDPRVTVTASSPVIAGEIFGRKSSSVGDVFVQDGVVYVVAPIGMKRLSV